MTAPHRRRLLVLLTSLCATALGGARAGEGPGEQTVTLAVVPLPPGKVGDLADLVTVGLLKPEGPEGIQLVERERVRAVLAEQGLGASGLAEPGTAVRLGRLLPADVLVFVERLGKVDPPACRVQIVETRTGVTLGAVLASETSLGEQASVATAAVGSALAKLVVPDAERRYVGILGFRSEEMGRALEGTAEATGALLSVDLGASPSVVLLDREHLEHLSRERNLTGVELELRSSAVLVDGALRRTADGKHLAVTVKFRPLAGGEEKTLSVRVPAGDLPAARRMIARAVLEALRARLPGLAGSDPKAEAAAFLDRSRVLVPHGELEAAVSTAEAALALDLGQPSRLAVATARNQLAWKLFKDAKRRLPRGSDLKDMLSETKLRILACHLREKSLRYELYRHHERRLAEGEENRVMLPVVEGYGGTIRIAAGPGQSGVRGLVEQIDRLDEEIARFLLDYHANRWPDLGAQNGWWGALTGSIAREIHNRAENAEDWSVKFREVVGLWESPPGEYDYQNRYVLPYALVECFAFGIRKKYTTPEEKVIVRETLGWMAGRRDPFVRLTARLCEVAFSVGRNAASARAALDILRDELPPDHADRQHQPSGVCLPIMLETALRAIRDPGEKAERCREIVEPLVNMGEATRLVGWERVILEWAKALEESGRPEEARRALDEAIEVLSRAPSDTRRYKADRMRAELEKALARLPQRSAARRPPDSLWHGYQVSRVNVGGPPAPKAKLVDAIVAGGRLVLVWVEINHSWVERKHRTEVLLHATSMPSAGGRGVKLGRARVKRSGGGMHRHQVGCLAADEDAVYVGSSSGGLVAFRRGKATVWTEAEGLPAEGVSSIACLGGKVYLGVGNALSASGLVEFDPQAGRFGVLISSRSPEPRTELDGGEPYWIGGLLADPERKCIWFAVSGTDREERGGLWRYYPETGRAGLVWKPKHYFQIMNMRWQDGKILATSASPLWSGGLQTLVSIDPERMEKVWLAGSGPRPSLDCNETPVFAEARVDLWPYALVGEHLLAGEAFLRLHTRGGGPPFALQHAPDGGRVSNVAFICGSAAGVLVGTADGDVWRIRPRGAPTEERRR